MDDEFKQLELMYQLDPLNTEIQQKIANLAHRGHPLARQLYIQIKLKEREEKRKIRDAGWGPRIINPDLLALEGQNMQIYSWKDSEYREDKNRPGNRIWTELTPDETDSFYLGDMDNLGQHGTPTYQHFLVPEYCMGSDYSGDSANQSNYNTILKEFENLRGVKRVYGSHGTYGIAIQLNTFNDDLIEMLKGLENYPVIDEEAMSELEMEHQNEAWENWARHDFISSLKSKFDLDDIWDDLKPPPEDNIDEFFEAMRDRANEYWIEETGSNAWIDIGRIIKVIEFNDLARLNITPETIFQWHWQHGLQANFEEKLRIKFEIRRPLSNELLLNIFNQALFQNPELNYESDLDLILDKVTTKILKQVGIDLEPGQMKFWED